MNNLATSWSTEGGRLVCRWSKSEESCEPTIPTDTPPAPKFECWNAEVVFELGDAA